MKITNDIENIGVNDREIDLFEGQYRVPNGMAYNSYVIFDGKIAVMDTVDKRFTREWRDNLSDALKGRKPDYLVVQHMEPDHSASIVEFMRSYPDAIVVSSMKAFTMMEQYFGTSFENRRMIIGEGGTLSLGKHTLTFLTAPMVHWPEVIVTYDSFDKVLFSADAFGKFGATDANEPWEDEARRYYVGIVAKYGAQVQALLKKVSALDVSIICSLHGPVLKQDLSHYIGLYDCWSSYSVEKEGVMIAYTSVYGHTKEAVELLQAKLIEKGSKKVVTFDLARCDWSEAVANAFAYGKTVLATTTYNMDIFPYMRQFIEHLTERGFKNRTVALIENGSWAPQAARVMRELLANSKDIRFAETSVKILSALNADNKASIDALAAELCAD